MYDLKKVYPPSFFRKREWLIGRSREISKRLSEMFHPKSVVDVGTGIGDMIVAFRELGIRATGIEGTDACEEHLMCNPADMVYHDIRTPLMDAQFHGLGICIEVAEHIDEPCIDIFIENLAHLASLWFISISSAKGPYHYTVKPSEWWIDKFKEHGFEYDGALVDEFRRLSGVDFGDDWHNRRSNIRMVLDNLYFFKDIERSRIVSIGGPTDWSREA